METELWLKRLEARMLRAGLPCSYVQRTVCELHDHAESSSQGHWQDNADELANDFVNSFRQSKWYRRVPSMFWLLLPIPLGVLTSVATFAIGIIALEISTDALERKQHVGLDSYALPWLFYAGLLIAPLIAVFLQFKIMEKVGRPHWVRRCSLAILMLFFFATIADYQSPSEFQEGHLHIEFSDESIAKISLFTSCVQVAMIAGVAWIEKRRKRDRLQLDT